MQAPEELTGPICMIALYEHSIGPMILDYRGDFKNFKAKAEVWTIYIVIIYHRDK